jgi:hypothetical protein
MLSDYNGSLKLGETQKLAIVTYFNYYLIYYYISDLPICDCLFEISIWLHISDLNHNLSSIVYSMSSISIDDTTFHLILHVDSILFFNS